MKKVYFAGSIRAGREDVELYSSLINLLKKEYIVLTEHIGDKNITENSERNMTDEEIYERDCAWLRESDFVVAEVSTPSLGVGYELGLAEALGKKVICLYRENSPKRLSAMISGDKYYTVINYSDLSVIDKIKEFAKNI